MRTTAIWSSMIFLLNFPQYLHTLVCFTRLFFYIRRESLRRINYEEKKLYSTRKKVSLTLFLSLPLFCLHAYSLLYRVNVPFLCIHIYSFTSQRDKSLLNDRVLYRICVLLLLEKMFCNTHICCFCALNC